MHDFSPHLDAVKHAGVGYHAPYLEKTDPEKLIVWGKRPGRNLDSLFCRSQRTEAWYFGVLSTTVSSQRHSAHFPYSDGHPGHPHRIHNRASLCRLRTIFGKFKLEPQACE